MRARARARRTRNPVQPCLHRWHCSNNVEISLQPPEQATLFELSPLALVLLYSKGARVVKGLSSTRLRMHMIEGN
jgi:hypothetical protein